jgi:hypothetical protein
LQQSIFFLQQSPALKSHVPFLEQQVIALFAHDEQPELLNAKAQIKKPMEQAKIMMLAIRIFVESFIILSPLINS